MRHEGGIAMSAVVILPASYTAEKDRFIVAASWKPETHEYFLVKCLYNVDPGRYGPGTEFYAGFTKVNWEIHDNRTSALANAFHIAAINNCGIIDKTRKA